jgi:hypothetical protein
METIKDCPFCGSKAIILERTNSHDLEIAYDVKCTNKLCYLCDGADWNTETSDEIIKIWNKRK